MQKVKIVDSGNVETMYACDSGGAYHRRNGLDLVNVLLACLRGYVTCDSLQNSARSRHSRSLICQNIGKWNEDYFSLLTRYN